MPSIRSFPRGPAINHTVSDPASIAGPRVSPRDVLPVCGHGRWRKLNCYAVGIRHRCPLLSADLVHGIRWRRQLQVLRGDELVGVDLPILPCNVSVHYDKDIMENRDSNKARVPTSYRAGSVAFVRPLELFTDTFGVTMSNQ